MKKTKPRARGVLTTRTPIYKFARWVDNLPQAVRDQRIAIGVDVGSPAYSVGEMLARSANFVLGAKAGELSTGKILESIVGRAMNEELPADKQLMSETCIDASSHLLMPFPFTALTVHDDRIILLAADQDRYGTGVTADNGVVLMVAIARHHLSSQNACELTSKDERRRIHEYLKHKRIQSQTLLSLTTARFGQVELVTDDKKACAKIRAGLEHDEGNPGIFCVSLGMTVSAVESGRVISIVDQDDACNASAGLLGMFERMQTHTESTALSTALLIHRIQTSRTEIIVEAPFEAPPKEVRWRCPRLASAPTLLLVPKHDVIKRIAKTHGEASIERSAHWRRAHWRHLRSAQFRRKQGQVVRVRESWVGPKEYKCDGKTYIVRTDV